MKKLYSIQYVRGVAAVAVVLFHASQRTGAHAFTVGAAGVDIFFVISGFIMWVISQERPVSPVAFMKDRIIRIAPIYWLASAVMVAGALAGLFPNLVLTGEHVLASFAFIPARSPSNGQVWPVLAQGWTLNYEMAFYAVFAVSLALASGRRLFLLAAVFGGLVLARAISGGGWFFLDFYGRPVVLEFVAGAVIGKLWLSGARLGVGASWCVVVLSITGFGCVNRGLLPYDVAVLGPCAVLIVAGMASLESAGHMPVSPALAYIGDASYSIYLWHSLAVSIVARAGGLLHLGASAQMILCVIGGTLVGIAGYEILERPLTRALRRVFRRPSKAAARRAQNA